MADDNGRKSARNSSTDAELSVAQTERMRPSIDTISPSVYYFGTPVVLVSTLNLDGSTHLTPISSAWALGTTYVIGLGLEHHGTRNLLRHPECVLNLVDADLVPAVERISLTTGSHPVPTHKRPRFRHEKDKWSLAGLTAIPSQTIRPARVLECPVQIESRVQATHRLGLDGAAMAVHLEVLRTHAHTEMIVPETSHIDLTRWQPAYYTFRHYFAQGAHVGQNARAEQAVDGTPVGSPQ
jgi:flavin reductase (DIM6/NTAB) family NADH-FMN oxidoreductase RutF